MFRDITTKKLIWDTVAVTLLAMIMTATPVKKIESPIIWILIAIGVVTMLGFHIGELLVRYKKKKT